MSKKLKKLIFLFVNVCIVSCFFRVTSFASLYTWRLDPKVNKVMVEDEEGQIKGKIIYDDIDNDGIAYYYYIDSDGYLLTDTICPDYHIVDASGRRLDKYGEPETKEIAIKSLEDGSGNSVSEIIPELYQQFLSDQDGNASNDSAISVGALRQMADVDGFGPNLFIQETISNGRANSIIGKGVVFKEKEKESFDSTIDSEMKNYIKAGTSYSKSVNGTTFSKSKWKAVMALKGTSAYIDFENPKNNFNKVSGRIATHYFTYSDRETKCTLYVFDDAGEEVFSASDFNYNSGQKFSFIFPRKSEFIRFELLVDGTYTTRVAYLRDLKYGFDREAWMEEQEEDAENAIIESMIAEGANEQFYDEEEEARRDALIDEETDVDDDGYTKAEREALASSSDAQYNDDYDDEDDDDDGDEDPDNLKTNEKDKSSGPSFDQALQEEARKKANYGPGFIGITID